MAYFCKVTSCILLLSLVGSYAAPCDEYSELDDAWRSVNVRPTSGNYHCDRGLTAGWYRFTGPAGDRMPSAAPESNSRCGTHSPVWLNGGQHPSIADGVVTRVACAVNSLISAITCSQSWQIQVAACSGGFYVYNLTQTPACNLAYCVENSVAVHNSICYKVPDRPAVDQQSSVQECADMAGSLAIIKDTATQSFVANSDLVGQSSPNLWVDIKSPVNIYLYGDNSPLQAQQLWAPDQPPEFCVYMDSGADYKFTVATCSEEHGFICQSDTAACQQDVCQNGGICASCFADTYKMCGCQPGFTGDRCEIDIDECSPSPCLNGGTCRHGVNSYNCTCPQGFDGVHCENDWDLCTPNPCPFNWNCVDNGGQLSCVSKAHIRQPDQSSFRCSATSCPRGMTCRDGGPGFYTCMP